MKKTIGQIKEEALSQLHAAPDLDRIRDLSVRYLGRKGEITKFLRSISNLPQEERPAAGKAANEVKRELKSEFEQAMLDLGKKAEKGDKSIDVSLPGRPVPRGNLHPITQTTQEICDIFLRLGFDIVEGPEVEKDYYNFEALNIPKNHPARDMQDTFYVSDDIVLRTLLKY